MCKVVRGWEYKKCKMKVKGNRAIQYFVLLSPISFITQKEKEELRGCFLRGLPERKGDPRAKRKGKGPKVI